MAANGAGANRERWVASDRLSGATPGRPVLPQALQANAFSAALAESLSPVPRDAGMDRRAMRRRTRAADDRTGGCGLFASRLRYRRKFSDDAGCRELGPLG